MAWAMPVLWLHLLAAMFWIGGQLFLVAIVIPVLRQELPEEQRVLLAAQVGRRFVVPSALALLLLLVTGPLNVVAHGFTWSDLHTTTWGRVLAVKVTLVAVVLVLTTIHARYFGHRLEDLAQRVRHDPTLAPQRRRVQRQSILLSVTNLIVNIIIVGLAAWLGTLP